MSYLPFTALLTRALFNESRHKSRANTKFATIRAHIPLVAAIPTPAEQKDCDPAFDETNISDSALAKAWGKFLEVYNACGGGGSGGNEKE